jgi:hypothetical protein
MICVRCVSTDGYEELLAVSLVRVSECEQVENFTLPIRYRLERRHSVGDDELRAEIGST